MGVNGNLTTSQRDNPNVENNRDANYLDTRIVKTHESRSNAMARFKNGQVDKSVREWLKLYCADYKIMGYSSAQIMDFMQRDFGNTIARGTVLKYIRQVFDQWTEDNSDSIGRRRSLEMAKIDKLETTYWEAWQESKENKNGLTIEEDEIPDEDGKMKKGTKRTKTRSASYSGDGQFLKGVEWCIEMRCKLFGLTKDSIDVTFGKSPSKEIDIDSLDFETLQKLRAAFKEAQTTVNSPKKASRHIPKSTMKSVYDNDEEQ